MQPRLQRSHAIDHPRPGRGGGVGFDLKRRTQDDLGGAVVAGGDDGGVMAVDGCGATKVDELDVRVAQDFCDGVLNE
jgi:hypothetical protein